MSEMEQHRAMSGASSLGGGMLNTAGERTESFLANLEALNNDLLLADAAIRSFEKEINAFVKAKEEEEKEWLANETVWLAELQELKEAAGGISSYEADHVAEEEQYWTSSRNQRDLVYGGCYLHDSVEYSDEDTEGTSDAPRGQKVRSKLSKPFSSVEAILEQKHFKGKLYYRVKWAGADVVSWEEADELKSIGALEHAIARLTADRKTSEKKLRPAVYIPKRAIASKDRSTSDDDARRYAGLWACEVEPQIWIPYDNGAQSTIEKAFMSRNPTVSFHLGNGSTTLYTIDFEKLHQTSANGGPKRNVKRIEQIPDAVLRQRVNDMTLDQLREYLSTVVEFTAVHYEALSRLHEEDKVHTHLTTKELASLPSMRFADLMNDICNGVTYSAFSPECAICLEEYQGEEMLVVMPKCGHFFHKKCAASYFGKFSNLCPFCKDCVLE